MKLQALLIVGFALGVMGCAEKEQATPAEEAVVEKAAEIAAAEMPADDRDAMGSAAFITHMHHHASQLEQLKAALEVGSLAAVQRSAYWLAGHDDVVGVPEDWQVHVQGLHAAAEAVAAAPDIATARAETQRIEDNCAACHAAAGVDIDSAQVD